MNDNYSQAGQDKFVFGLIKDNSKHYFLDIGCYLPKALNNTLLLEEYGWDGISIDILDFKKEWEVRNTKFIQADALTTNYEDLLNNNNIPIVIDYLNVDIEGEGLRFAALKKVFESTREFKIITIEHDSYRGYRQSEAYPQRELLKQRGYFLVCEDVSLTGNVFEDWWINPKFFNRSDYDHLISMTADYADIIKKIK